MAAGAIVLAAGDSTRMGEHKILLPYNGVTVIEHIVRQLQIAGIRNVVVVTGRDAADVENALSTTSVDTVHNPDYKDGMLTSVRAGLKALQSDVSGAFVCIGDQPGLRAEGVTELRWSTERAPEHIHIPTYRERRGHPVYIPRRCWLRVFNEFDDVGLRGLFRTEEESVVHVELDAPWVVEDIDYPEDYARALKKLEDER